MRRVESPPAPYPRWIFPGCAVLFVVCVVLAALMAILVFGRARPAPPRRILWRTWVPDVPPLLGPFRSAGVEDYAGVFCEHDDSGGRSCWLSAIDGSTFESLWRIGPFEDAAATGIRAVLAGDRIVVAYGTGRIATYRSSAGEEISSTQTQHLITDACVGPPPETLIWFDTSTGIGLLVEPSSGRATEAGRPAWCPKLPAGVSFRPRARLVPPEEVAAALAEQKDFVLDRILESGGTYVALGYQFDVWRNKTATAIRFDPRERVVLWRQSIGPTVQKHLELGAADIAGDTMAVFYPEPAKAMFALLDLGTGHVHCTRPVGGPLSIVSPTIGLTKDRLAFYLGPLQGNADMLVHSTATCEDFPKPTR